jgi:hypothetical protein
VDIGKKKGRRHRLEEIVASLQDFTHVFPLCCLPSALFESKISAGSAIWPHSIPLAKKVNIDGLVKSPSAAALQLFFCGP